MTRDDPGSSSMLRRWMQRYLPCINTQNGCYLFLFFAVVKLMGVLILVILGRNHAPHFLQSVGLCDTAPLVIEEKTPITTTFTSQGKHDFNLNSFKNSLSNLKSHIPGINNESGKQKQYTPRIMCLMFTTPSAWPTKGRAVNETWVPRCDAHKFFYSDIDSQRRIPTVDAVPLMVPDGRDHLTAKTMEAFRFAYDEYHQKIDWFLKADDDTYIIIENLRLMLSALDPSKPHYVGGRSSDLLEHGYNGGGAGYALSHEAARLIIEEGHNYPSECKQDGGVEDLDIGHCLEQFKVYPSFTEDFNGRKTFHPDHPYKIFANLGDNKRVYSYNKSGSIHGNPRGIRTMSPYTVSFHSLEPGHMYMYDFLLYDLRRDVNLIYPNEHNKT